MMKDSGFLFMNIRPTFDSIVFDNCAVKLLLDQRMISNIIYDFLFTKEVGEINTNVNQEECEFCKRNVELGKNTLCKKHSAIQRIMDTRDVIKVIDVVDVRSKNLPVKFDGLYLSKSDMFGFCENSKKLLVIDCPPINLNNLVDDSWVRKINVFTYDGYSNPNTYKIVKTLDLNTLNHEKLWVCSSLKESKNNLLLSRKFGSYVWKVEANKHQSFTKVNEINIHKEAEQIKREELLTNG